MSSESVEVLMMRNKKKKITNLSCLKFNIRQQLLLAYATCVVAVFFVIGITLCLNFPEHDTIYNSLGNEVLFVSRFLLAAILLSALFITMLNIIKSYKKVMRYRDGI